MSAQRTVIDDVRRALGRQASSPIPPRPPLVAPRVAAEPDAELDRLIAEVQALSGVAARIEPAGIDQALQALVDEHRIRRATLCPTTRLTQLELATRLARLRVEIVSPHADKKDLAQCDLGVTEADFALPETGTLGLFSSRDQPRAVSLLPRVHLALVARSALRADLHQVFAEARQRHYLVFVTGPSRTADIELTVTLGVHGPRSLHVWVV